MNECVEKFQLIYYFIVGCCENYKIIYFIVI